MSKTDGGRAFPHDTLHIYEDVEHRIPHGGMSLRDWFAGQAVMAIVANSSSVFPASGFTPWARHAEEAYKVADAMLAERAK